MRFIDDRGRFDQFVKAVRGFPPTARDGRTAAEVFAESYALLEGLARGTPVFPRAMAWNAYALALSVYESWPLPQSSPHAGSTADDRLAYAKQLALEAIDHDPNDYDLHWALADVCLIRGEFDEMREEFKLALYLNGDERHPNLFAEAGAAMMGYGDLDTAQRYFRKARPPDWHRWMKGILLLIKAGRAGEQEETFLDLALDELRQTSVQPGDDLYQMEIQLVTAAAQLRKTSLLDDKAQETDQPERSQIENAANRSRTSALNAFEVFRAEFAHWTDPQQAKSALQFQESVDRDYWDGLIDDLWGTETQP